MLGSSDSSRFHAAVLKSVQRIQTRLYTDTLTLQQQITALANRTTSLESSSSGGSFTGTLTKANVGLANVDNTSDMSKPVSSATSTALTLKQNLLSDTNQIPQSYVTSLTSDLGTITANVNLKANASSLVYANIKASSAVDAISLQTQLTNINTSLDAKATTTALSVTNTEVALKANTTDLLYQNIRLNNTVGAEVLSNRLTYLENGINSKAATSQLIFSGIKKSGIDTTTLETTLSTMNTNIGNRALSSDLIFSGIKKSAVDTTTLESTLTTMDTTIASKRNHLYSYFVTNVSSSTTFTLSSQANQNYGKNKILIFQGASFNSTACTHTTTLPVPSSFNEGDFYHFITISNGKHAVTVSVTYTIYFANSDGSTTATTVLAQAPVSNSLGVNLMLQIMTIDGVKRWIRVL